jgi:hypothetical protein
MRAILKYVTEHVTWSTVGNVIEEWRWEVLRQ